MPKTVLILGGSLAGLGIAHRLLKYTLPSEPDLKVVLVSKNSHFYWNIASVRAVIPSIVQDDQILAPIQPGLVQYPRSSWDFVVGEATHLDAPSRTVTVSTVEGELLLTYDYLVLATGAHAADESMPWKAAGTHEELLERLHGTAEEIDKAGTIVIAGAGATGVELAGEIRFQYPQTKTILINAHEQLVGGDSIAASVERELVKLGVEIKKNVRVEGTKTLEDGRIEVQLGDGQTIVTDVYLPTMGLRPNTAFVPTEWLEKGYVDVDEFMRVPGAEGVWAAGDVVSKPRASYLNTEAHATCVAKNIELTLQNNPPQPVKYPPVDVFLCSTGRSRGAGRLGYVHVPSLAVWVTKGRTLGMERTSKYADGSMW